MINYVGQLNTYLSGTRYAFVLCGQVCAARSVGSDVHLFFDVSCARILWRQGVRSLTSNLCLFSIDYLPLDICPFPDDICTVVCWRHVSGRLLTSRERSFADVTCAVVFIRKVISGYWWLFPIAQKLFERVKPHVLAFWHSCLFCHTVSERNIL